jgi:hypothetical protein
MKSLRLLFTIAVIVAITSHVSSQSIIGDSQDWGPVSGGLRMSISPVTSGNMPRKGAEFYVAIQNVGAKDVVLNLGTMLANGRVMFPQAIRLILTDTQGKPRELHFVDKRYPAVIGRVDDFTVSLRSGSIYILRVTLDQFWSMATKEFALTLAAGRHQISARLEGQGAKAVTLDMQGIALMNFWKGTVESNSFEFEVAGNIAPK